MKQVTILGATGSIGQSTLDIVARHPDLYALYALTANDNHQKMQALCRQFEPAFVVMRDADSAQLLAAAITDLSTEVLSGEAGLTQVAEAVEVDVVVAAIVGAEG